jgi:hypothetical protein
MVASLALTERCIVTWMAGQRASKPGRCLEYAAGKNWRPDAT